MELLLSINFFEYWLTLLINSEKTSENYLRAYIQILFSFQFHSKISYRTFSHTYSNIFFIKISHSLNIQWSRKIPTTWSIPRSKFIQISNPSHSATTLTCHSKCRKKIDDRHEFFVAATVFSLTIGWVRWRIFLSLSSIYLYVIFIGVVFRFRRKIGKERIPETIQYTPHFILVHFFLHAYLWWCEVISVKSRKTHFDLPFHWLLHKLLLMFRSFFFAGSFKAHNMFHSYSGGKIIHLISLNRIKRQRVEKKYCCSVARCRRRCPKHFLIWLMWCRPSLPQSSQATNRSKVFFSALFYVFMLPNEKIDCI